MVGPHRRWLVVTSACLALATTLAGCGTPDGPVPEPITPRPPFPVEVPVRFEDYLEPPTDCSLIICLLGASPPWPQFEFAANQTLVGLALRIDGDYVNEQGEPAEVHLEAVCLGNASGCSRPMVTAEGPLPLTLEANDMDTGFGPVIELRYWITNTVSGWSWIPMAASSTAARVEGVFTAMEDPDLPVRPLERNRVVTAHEGDTGPCMFLVDCNCFPCGGDLYVDPQDGTLTDIDVNITWAPDGPTSEQLTATLSCNDTGSNRFCPDDARFLSVSGGSPLRLRTDAAYPPGVTLHFQVRAPLENPSGSQFVPAAVQQAYRLEGAYTLVTDPNKPTARGVEEAGSQ